MISFLFVFKSLYCLCRWLVEDYAMFASLSRLLPPDAFLGVIETTYTLELSLVDFVNEL